MSLLVLKSYLLRGMKKICTFFDFNLYYTSKYGFKQIVSMKKYKDISSDYPLGRREFFEPEEFFLSFDGLKDEYTDLGKKITEAPHYELIKACAENDLKNCVYIINERLGKLDSRDTVLYDTTFHMKSYRKAYSELMDGSIRPIVYYRNKNKKYVVDGKHRLALCAYFNKPVSACEISISSQNTDYVKAFCKKLKRHRNEYSKNFELMEDIIKG